MLIEPGWLPCCAHTEFVSATLPVAQAVTLWGVTCGKPTLAGAMVSKLWARYEGGIDAATLCFGVEAAPYAPGCTMKPMLEAKSYTPSQCEGMPPWCGHPWICSVLICRVFWQKI